MSETPEQKARREIDANLTAAGWLVQSREGLDLTAARGIAVREFPMKSGFGFADYLLYLDRKSLGAVEAKAEGTLTGVEAQSAKYAAGLPDIVREDFWTSTSNKQLNFVQHIYTLLKINGRAAVVVPDNVLFEGGAGEKVRRNLLQKCNVHTLLRLPTGIWYSPGVKANVLFFEKKEGRAEPWTDKLWVYDLRTNLHFTLKQSPIQRKDFDEFVTCYKPGEIHKRKPTWTDANPEGRWRCYGYEDLLKRDKLSLDLFWIKDQSLTDTDSLPAPDVLAQDLADDLETALEQFTKIAAKLAKK